MTVRTFIHRYLWWTYRPIKKLCRDIAAYKYRKAQTKKLDILAVTPAKGCGRVFYLGITEQPNLGDMAQHYCILQWIRENYSEYELVKFESSVVTDRRFGFVEKFKSVYKPSDVIIFQSGYCTQDLGGDHELMHRIICDAMPEARILMMPQTIFFQEEENKLRTSRSYNQARNMLFLARDSVSYEMAKEMFPNIQVLSFPDIVTTLIGKFDFRTGKRSGICLCCRNDGEKYYTDEEISKFTKDLSMIAPVVIKDTQGKSSYREIRENLWENISEEIESYSSFKVTITDRYHGTIFSLAASTPVIIIRTTDHKVITGAEWFKDNCDVNVQVASDLKEALILCNELYSKNKEHNFSAHFKENYYDNLKMYFDNSKH